MFKQRCQTPLFIFFICLFFSLNFGPHPLLDFLDPWPNAELKPKHAKIVNTKYQQLYNGFYKIEYVVI